MKVIERYKLKSWKDIITKIRRYFVRWRRTYVLDNVFIIFSMSEYSMPQVVNVTGVASLYKHPGNIQVNRYFILDR